MLSYDNYTKSLAETDDAAPHSLQTMFRIGVDPDRYIDMDAQYGRAMTAQGTECPMSEKGLRLLAMLAENPGQPISKQDLIDAADCDERSLPRHMREMYQALGKAAAKGYDNIIVPVNKDGDQVPHKNKNYGWMALLDNSVPMLTQTERGPQAPDIRYLGDAAGFIALDLRDPKRRLAVAEDASVLPLKSSSGAILHILAGSPNEFFSTSEIICGAGLQSQGYRLTSIFNEIRRDLGTTADGTPRSQAIIDQHKEKGAPDRAKRILEYCGLLDEEFVPPDPAWFIQAVRKADKQF